jgi:hypothetical protein
MNRFIPHIHKSVNLMKHISLETNLSFLTI